MLEDILFYKNEFRKQQQQQKFVMSLPTQNGIYCDISLQFFPITSLSNTVSDNNNNNNFHLTVPLRIMSFLFSNNSTELENLRDQIYAYAFRLLRMITLCPSPYHSFSLTETSYSLYTFLCV